MFVDAYACNTEKEVIKLFLVILTTKQNGANSCSYVGTGTELPNQHFFFYFFFFLHLVNLSIIEYQT